MRAKARATIEDLYKMEGKAELVNGEIVEMPPAGDEPGYAGGEIFAALRDYVRSTKGRRHMETAWDSTYTFRIGKPSVWIRNIMSAHARVCGSWKGRYLCRRTPE
jgi:Uma2 family endonuclease